MRHLTTLLMALAGGPLLGTQNMARERPATEVSASDALLARLLRTGAIRRASAREDRAVRAAIMARGAIASTFDFYVVRKPLPPLHALNGGAAVNFLVPASVTITDYGTTHSNFYRASGLCLHGALCPPCPETTPSLAREDVLDATAAGCVALPSPRTVTIAR